MRHPGVKRITALLAVGGLVAGLVVVPASVSAQDGVIKQLANGTVAPSIIDTGNGQKRAPSISAGTLAAVTSADMRQEEADAGASAALSPGELEEFRTDIYTLGRRILDESFYELEPCVKRLCGGCDFVPLCRKHEEFNESFSR